MRPPVGCLFRRPAQRAERAIRIDGAQGEKLPPFPAAPCGVLDRKTAAIIDACVFCCRRWMDANSPAGQSYCMSKLTSASACRPRPAVLARDLFAVATKWFGWNAVDRVSLVPATQDHGRDTRTTDWGVQRDCCRPSDCEGVPAGFRHISIWFQSNRAGRVVGASMVCARLCEGVGAGRSWPGHWQAAVPPCGERITRTGGPRSGRLSTICIA